jgi:outer membrane protein assembly factor BamB
MRERAAALESRKKLSSRIDDLRKKRESARNDARREIDSQIRKLTEQIRALDQKCKELEDSLLKWRIPCEQPSSMILAGDVLFLGGEGSVLALEAGTGKTLWSTEVNGRASGLAVSGGRLFVSTNQGAIHCFGETPVQEAEHVKPPVTPQPYPEDERTPLYAAAAESIVNATGAEKGYCLVLGCRTGRLAFELARRTDLRIIGIEPDEQKVKVARMKLDAAGLYGSRITVDRGSLSKLPYPDYFANLVVSDEMLVSGEPCGSSAEMFRVLRPGGGVAYFGQPTGTSRAGQPLDVAQLLEWLRDGGLSQWELRQRESIWARITRPPLKGAGKWTHLYADPANTACSDDHFVNCPLGLLWFGDPGPERMVERHARAAGPLSLNGRLFVQGENVVMAYDAYNGFPLWRREIPGAVRVRVDADGSNLAASEHGLFVATGGKCLRLDPATGETLRTYDLPPATDGAPRRWGYVACLGNSLFGSTAEPMAEYGALWRELVQPDGTWRPLPKNVSSETRRTYEAYVSKYPSPDARAYADFEEAGEMWQPMGRFPKWGDIRSPQGALTRGMKASHSIFAVDTETGSVRWVHRGERMAHPTISIGGGMLFFAESSISAERRQEALAEKLARLARLEGEAATELRREIENADVRLVVALDMATGEKRWEKVLDLTGCGGDRLASAYHPGGHGILFFFGAFSNHDRGLFRSGTLRWRRVTALSASDGSLMWSRELGYLRRPVVMGDMLIVEPWMCDIRTGELKTRIHPITGKEVPWEFIRGGHSCGVTTASPNCFFLRSYSTTYYDLNRDSGMLPFGTIRPGCWVNIIIANGLVLFPEASSGCRCSFPMRCSVAFAPRQPADENRPWSIFPRRGAQTPGDDALTPVKHLAINFGAPGERKDKDGTLWFGYPRPQLADLQVAWVLPLDFDEEILPRMGYFSRNFRGMQIEGTDKPWLFASGCCGLKKCEVPLLGKGDGPATYTVRLCFAALADDRPGQRVFDIVLQNEIALDDFDIVREAGAPQKAVVKEFKGVRVTDTLAVELVPKVESPTEAQAPLINAIEIVREEG